MSVLALAYTPAVNLRKDPYLGSDAQSTYHSLEDWSEPAEGSSFVSVLALAYTPAVNLAEGSSLMSLRPLAVVAHRHTPREIAPVAVLQLVE